jgi:hypothetical protein
MAGNFLVEAAVTLLKFAKSTSDPNLTAALIDKAAELNERIAAGTASGVDASPKAPDVTDEQLA